MDGLSTDQRCFVAWSQLWIYKAREERIRLLAATDYHAIGFVRAVAPLLNLDAFHRAFGTPAGRPDVAGAGRAGSHLVAPAWP